jgi:hypothetical protein
VIQPVLKTNKRLYKLKLKILDRKLWQQPPLSWELKLESQLKRL